MKVPILTLRISRRAIGAAVLRGNELSFVDGRHLRSVASRAVPAGLRYIRRVVELTKPSTVVVEAPREPGSSTDQIVNALVREPIGSIPVEVLPTASLFVAFGVPALANRAELRASVERMFPELAAMRTTVRPYVLDAGAAALYVESAAALGVPL